jgi:hypothetical protein
MTVLWLIIRQLADFKSSFVVKIATFAKPETVSGNTKTRYQIGTN